MPQFRFDVKKRIHTPTAIVRPVNSDTGELVVSVEEVGPSYPVFFSYGSVEGCLSFRQDSALIQLLNDSLPHAIDHSYATPDDLAALIHQIETRGIAGGSELTHYFQQTYGEVLGPEFLERLRTGVQFTPHYPLEISAPEADFKALLKRRGPCYSWRREFWEPVGEDIDIATYPAREGQQKATRTPSRPASSA